MERQEEAEPWREMICPASHSWDALELDANLGIRTSCVITLSPHSSPAGRAIGPFYRRQLRLTLVNGKAEHPPEIPEDSRQRCQKSHTGGQEGEGEAQAHLA